MRYIFILTPLAIFLLANFVTKNQVTPEPEETAPVEVVKKATTIKLFGEKLSDKAPITLDTVLKAPESFAGQSVIVTGVVRKVCQKKGCWMEMSASNGEAQQGSRITFKDYGFFVPMNSAGSLAKIEGVIEIKKLNKAEVEHLESDGAVFAHKTPQGEAHEVRLVAAGVELTSGS